jgi:hypothetical protein
MMQNAWLTTSSAMAERKDATEGYFRFYKELADTYDANFIERLSGSLLVLPPFVRGRVSRCVHFMR